MPAEDFHAKWYGDCSRCDATDVPMFCCVGEEAVCTSCFVAAIDKYQSEEDSSRE